MNSLEKLRAVGEAIYGKNWQSPLARALGISSRSIRYFISGESRVPETMSGRLLNAVETEMKKLDNAKQIINSDKMRGDDITTEIIDEIVNRYHYSDEQVRKAAIDAINNAVYEETWLSDLDAIARKFASY